MTRSRSKRTSSIVKSDLKLSYPALDETRLVARCSERETYVVMTRYRLALVMDGGGGETHDRSIMALCSRTSGHTREGEEYCARCGVTKRDERGSKIIHNCAHRDLN